VSTQRWIKLRKIVRPLLVPAVVLLLKLDWCAALILSVSVVFVFGLPVMTGYWMARDTSVARYWSPLQRWSREPDEKD
jgi:hypothetical protein